VTSLVRYVIRHPLARRKIAVQKNHRKQDSRNGFRIEMSDETLNRPDSEHAGVRAGIVELPKATRAVAAR